MQTLYISVDGDTKGFVSALKKAENVSVSSGKRMATGVGQATKAYELLKGAVVAYLGIGLVRETVRIADTYSLLESRLKLVTSGTEELKTVQSELLGIANESRVSYEATANLYARLGRSTEQLGTSQSDLLKVTETISKALIVSGASATEAENALIQLSQGLASGTLRGDELRSVLEQVPRVAKAIADGMGITVGQLREFGAEGKLTAEAVIPALISQLGKIDEEFEQIDVTASQAGSVLKNVIFDIVDSANDGSEATKSLSSAILDMADTLTENKDEIVSVFTGMVEGISAVIKTTAALANTFAGFKAVGDGTLSFFELATSNAEELDAKLDEIAKSGGTAEALRNRLGGVNSEIKWLSEQMGKSGPENAKKYQAEINRLQAEMKGILETLDDMAMGYESTEKVAEDSADTQQKVAKETARVRVEQSENARDKAEKELEREVEAAIKAGEEMTDSWELMYQDRYEIQSRALEAEIQAEQNRIAEVDAALSVFYADVNAMVEESTSFTAMAFEALFVGIENDGREHLGAVADAFGDWAEELVSGKFVSIGDAWKGLWSGMLRTVTNTVADMAAQFVVDEIVGNFFHTGAWKVGDRLGQGEHPAIVKDNEMIIPETQSAQIRDAMGNLKSFDALVRIVREGMGDGPGTTSPEGALDLSGTGGLTSPATRTSAYEEAFGFVGGILGNAAINQTKVAGVPGISSIGRAIGGWLGGLLGDRVGDWADDRGYEGIRDAYEAGDITGYEAHQFEQAAKAANIDHGSKFGKVRDAYMEMENQMKDVVKSMFDSIGGGDGGFSPTGPGTFGGGPGADLGAEPGGGGGFNDGPGGFGDRDSSPGGMGGLAAGGILTGPTMLTPWHYGGEAGPEGVIPLHAGPDTLKRMHDDIRRISNMKIEIWVQGNELIPTQKLDGRIKLVSDGTIVERNRRGIRPTERVYAGI